MDLLNITGKNKKKLSLLIIILFLLSQLILNVGTSVNIEQKNRVSGYDIKINDDKGNANQSFPAIAIDKNDVIYAAWEDKRNDVSEIFFSKSIDNGETFSTNVKVSDINGYGPCEEPDIAVDSLGIIHIVWHDGREWPRDIYYANSTDGGLSFNKNKKINDNVKNSGQYEPCITIDKNDNIHVAWTDMRNDPNGAMGGDDPDWWDIYYSKSTDHGITFNENIRVITNMPDPDPDGDFNYNPDISTDSNCNPHIVWQGTIIDVGNDELDILYSKSNDGGLTFNSYVKVDDNLPNVNCRWPSITIDTEDIIHVAWSDERNRVGDTQNNSDIRYTKSIDNGNSFQSSIQVNDDPGVEWQSVTSITVDKNNNVSVAWEDWRNDNADIYLSSIGINESSFKPNVRVNNDLGKTGQYWPSIAVNSTGQVFVAWQDGRNSNFDIYISNPALNLSNLPPIAIIDSPLNSATHYTNEIINFIGSNSYDPDNDTLSFYWTSNLSDSIGYTSEFNTTLPIGSHLITLYVDDGHNHNVSTSTNISIINRPPIPVIDSPKTNQSYYSTELVYFDGFNSSDPDFDILTFYWTSNISGRIGFTPRFNLSLPEGYHLITLFVDDNYGHNVSTTTTISITPLPEPVNLPPIPVIDWPENNTVFRNDRPIYFDGANSTDPDNDGLSFYWYSDYHGYLSSQPKFSKLIILVGFYKITLFVNDGHGHNISTSVFIEIHYVPPPNKPPLAVISSPLEGQIFSDNSTIYFDAMNSTDPDDDILTYNWESNISGELGNQDHFLMQLEQGYHMITLSVYDNRNHVSKAYVNISIRPREPSNDTEPNGSIEIESPHENSLSFTIIVILLIVLIIIIALVITLIILKSLKPPQGDTDLNSLQSQRSSIEKDEPKTRR